MDINNKDNVFLTNPSINNQKITRSKGGTDYIPYLEALVDVKFEKGQVGFCYKTSFNEHNRFCNFVKKTIKMSNELLSTPTNNCPRGV